MGDKEQELMDELLSKSDDETMQDAVKEYGSQKAVDEITRLMKIQINNTIEICELKKQLNTRLAPLPKECEEAIEWLDPHIDYLKEMTDETRDSFFISEHWATIRSALSKPNGVS